MPVVQLPENQVFQPPLIEPVLDQTGRMSHAWARWMQALYMRTSYEGNAIDNTVEAVDDNSEQTDQNTANIQTNAETIAAQGIVIQSNTFAIQVNTDQLALVVADVNQNALNIESNITAISANASAIDDLQDVDDQFALDLLTLTGNLQASRNRIFGDTEPSLYDDTSTSYSAGDYVVSGNLGSGSDYYYRAKAAIPAPAGAFNPSLWDKIALNSYVPVVDLLAFSSLKALSVVFKGRATAGAVTPVFDYNLDSLEQVSTGVYEGSFTQTTFYGSNILSKTIPVFNLSVAPSPSTEMFTADYEDLGAGDFRISVFEVTKGAGSDLIKTPYDPDDTNDLVSLILLTDIGSGALPPA